MKGYLTRGGIGMLAGASVLFLAAAVPLQRLDRVDGAGYFVPPSSAPAMSDAVSVGPFQTTVERFEIHTYHAGSQSVHRAFVQFHLWRPAGPVPMPQRVRVDGRPALGGLWVWMPGSTSWLLKNEMVDLPPGKVLHHPVLGDVPATRHAGEMRAVFEFIWAGDDTPPPAVTELTFRLPDGWQGTFHRLHATLVDEG